MVEIQIEAKGHIDFVEWEAVVVNSLPQVENSLAEDSIGAVADLLVHFY